MSDYISRQAAIDALCKAGCNSEWCGVSCPDVLAIEQLPSAPVREVVKGEWVKDSNGNFICSVCHSGYKEQPTLMGKPMFEFCPMCGADMRKE